MKIKKLPAFRSKLALAVLACTPFITPYSFADEKINIGSNPAWLVNTLDNDNLFMYARFPNVWGTFNAKDNIIKQAQSNPNYIAQVDVIQTALVDTILNQISTPESKAALKLVFEQLNAPVEMAVLKNGSTPIDMTTLLATKLQLRNIEQFKTLLNDFIKNSKKAVSITQATSDDGKGSLAVNGLVTINYQYDINTQKFLASVTYANNPPPALPKIITDTTEHAFLKTSKQYDQDAYGLLVWANPKQLESFLPMMLNKSQLQEIQEFGLDKMQYVMLSYATVDQKIRFQLKADISNLNIKQKIPAYHHTIDIASVGNPRSFSVIALPPTDLISPWLSLVAPEYKSYADLGMAALAAFDSNIQFIGDDLGTFPVFKVKDKQKFNDLIKMLEKYPNVKYEQLTSKDQIKLSHLNIQTNTTAPSMINKNDHAADDNEMLIQVLNKLLTGDLYWLEEENNNLVLSNIPQDLIDRAKNAQKINVSEWIKTQQKINLNDAVLGYTTTSRNLPKDSYYAYLAFLQLLANASHAENKILNIPSAQELKLPEFGGVSFKLGLSNSELAIESNSDLGLLDSFVMLKRAYFNLESVGLFGSIGTVGIVSAFAMPAYQDYTVRTKVLEAISPARELKSLVESAYKNKKDLKKLNDSDLKIDMAKYTNKQTSSVRIENGAIIFKLNDFVIPYTFGGEIKFKPQLEKETMTWTCVATNIRNKYLPVDCRN